MLKFFTEKSKSIEPDMTMQNKSFSYILMLSVASVMLVARDEHSDPNAEKGDTDREDEVGV